jgi:hypothetical protein
VPRNVTFNGRRIIVVKILFYFKKLEIIRIEVFVESFGYLKLVNFAENNFAINE